MKQFLFIILLAPLSSYCQPKIMGIGKFQIGKCSTSTIADLSKEFNIPIKETADDLATRDEFNYNDTPSKILYISRDANEGKLFSHGRYIAHPSVKVYYINNLRIADLLFHDIFLNFYRDTLYSLETDGSEYIDTALELKYGPPKIRVQSKIITCSNAFRDFDHIEKTYYLTWNNSQKHITACSVHGFYYNDKCEKSELEYLSIYDLKRETLIENEVHNTDNNSQLKKNKERKKALTDL